MTLYATFDSLDYADPDAELDLEPAPGHTGPVPQGLALDEALRDRLVASGRSVENRWATVTGHAFDVHLNGRRFDVVFQLDDPEAGRWSLSVERRRGFFPWARRPDPIGTQAVAEDVHDALSANPRIANVRWYTDAQWVDGRPTAPGTPTPPGPNP